MQISPATAWTDCVQQVAQLPTGERALRWVAHPDADFTLPQMATAMNSDGVSPATVYVAVGPEGGFTSDEVQLASQAGWSTVSLGPRMLRVETAALAICALILMRQ
jgi:16S rRNA (uracil1498-N3)-methyltransferase